MVYPLEGRFSSSRNPRLVRHRLLSYFDYPSISNCVMVIIAWKPKAVVYCDNKLLASGKYLGPYSSFSGYEKYLDLKFCLFYLIRFIKTSSG